MTPMKKFSIIIPIFNEEKTIGSILNQLFNLITLNKSLTCEIIVINDGSTDQSANILKNYKITLVNHLKRLGYGASLKDGIKHANYDNLAILDADGTYPPSELFKLLKNKGHAPLIIGIRSNYFSLSRHFANKILAAFASILFQKKVTDLNSGMRVFRKEVVEKFQYNSWPDGFSFTTTMTLHYLINKMKIHAIPIRCESRLGTSKINVPQLGLNILKIILHFFKLKHQKRLPRLNT